VGAALNSATQRLKEAEVDTAFLDAQVILCHVLGVERPWLFAHGETELTSRQANHFTELIARRVHQEPVAYLVGWKEFYGLELRVDRRVLIPRPETEMLVDEVLREVDGREGLVTVADIGTGSAAIALAIAANAKNVHVFAVDVSRGALAVARANVHRLDARHAVTLLRGDLLGPVPEAVDIIVANLPYISSTGYVALETTVRDYEPRMALESGVQGLDAIARLLEQAGVRMKAYGKIYLEIGCDQANEVLRLVAEHLPQAADVAVHRDHQGHERMVAIAF
jgi:release factor glutamine methyltransferase